MFPADTEAVEHHIGLPRVERVSTPTVRTFCPLVGPA
jgi:hypothetical protein